MYCLFFVDVFFLLFVYVLTEDVVAITTKRLLLLIKIKSVTLILLFVIKYYSFFLQNIITMGDCF